LNGELDRVEVLISRSSIEEFAPAGNPAMSLFTAPAGIPSVLLGATTVDRAAVPEDFDEFVAFDFAPLHIRVHPGDVLAVVMDTAVLDDLYSWSLGVNDPYPHGTAMSQFGSGPWTSDSLIYPNLGEMDRAFKTYVNEIPEPATIILVTVTGLALAMERKSARRTAR